MIGILIFSFPKHVVDATHSRHTTFSITGTKSYTTRIVLVRDTWDRRHGSIVSSSSALVVGKLGICLATINNCHLKPK